MQRGVTCSGSLTDVGVEDECGGEICSHTFLSIISFMSSRFIPILNISPSTSLCKLWHMHTHVKQWRDTDLLPQKQSLVSPVGIKGAGVPRQAHVVLHLQSSMLLLLVNVLSLQLVLSLHHAPQHLIAEKSSANHNTSSPVVTDCFVNCFRAT